MLEETAKVLVTNVKETEDIRHEDGTIGPTHYGELSAFVPLSQTNANKLLTAWAATNTITKEERQEYHTTDGDVIIVTSHEARGVIRHVRRYPIRNARHIKITPEAIAQLRCNAFYAREVEPRPDKIPHARKSILRTTFQFLQDDYFIYHITVEWSAITTATSPLPVITAEIEQAHGQAVLLYNMLKEMEDEPVITAGISLAFTPDTTRDMPDLNHLLQQFTEKVQQFSTCCQENGFFLSSSSQQQWTIAQEPPTITGCVKTG